MSAQKLHVGSRRAIVAFACLMAALFTPAPGSAQSEGSSVSAEVLVVLAKEAPGTIAPELASIQALRRPPFNGFRTMEILERPTLELRAGEDSDVHLPNGRRLRVTLLRVTRDGRYQVRVSINRPEQHDYLPLLTVVTSPGDPFFVAGQAHDGGTLVIGIRIGTSTAALGPVRPDADIDSERPAERRGILFIDRLRPAFG